MENDSDSDNRHQNNAMDSRNISPPSTSTASEKDKNKCDRRKRHLSDENSSNLSKTARKEDKKEEKNDDCRSPFLHQNQEVHNSLNTNNYLTFNKNALDSYVDALRTQIPMNPPQIYMFPPINRQWPLNPMEGMNMPPANQIPSSLTSSLPISTNMPANHISTSLTSPVPVSTNTNMPNNPNPVMNSNAFMGMPNTPMHSMANFCPFPMINKQNMKIPPPGKEIITLSKCVLYPPNPNFTFRPSRLRPPGCKTVFVGGLPEKITEEIVREMFEPHGDIVTIRMSKKNFCHIRFSSECHVDRAFFLSGYRIKVENKDDSSHYGRIHVDFAEARDDQYDYECSQRALRQEAQQRGQSSHTITTPSVVRYSDHEAIALGTKLYDENTLVAALQVLVTWLQRGECNKQNANFFCFAIQIIYNHVRHLKDRCALGEESDEAKQKRISDTALQFNEIDKLFDAISFQSVLDQFTKSQRKMIKSWKKKTSDIKMAYFDELLADRVKQEMESSDEDDDDDDFDTDGSLSDSHQEQEQKLREEVDMLRNLLRTSNEEVETMKKKLEIVNSINVPSNPFQQKCLELQSQLEECQRLLRMKSQHGLNGGNVSSNMFQSLPGNISVSSREARLIALITTFLNVHPSGANIDYICSYLVEFDSGFNVRDVESLMKRFPTVFKEEYRGIGATLEKKWITVALKTD